MYHSKNVQSFSILRNKRKFIYPMRHVSYILSDIENEAPNPQIYKNNLQGLNMTFMRTNI